MLAITSTTKNTYLHSLHFRIISRIITTNRFLYTIRQKESPVCSFCSVEVETLDHLFWTCPKTKNFLQRVQTLLSERIQLRITFQKSKWFIPAPENCSEVEILIITVAKSVIYRARNKNQQPNDRCFFHCLRAEVLKENILAQEKGNMQAFNDRWGELGLILA